MAPIQIALVGLSSGAKASWAAEGHLPYLLSKRGRANYEILALLNSSVKAAEAAKQHFDLPSTVRAYGDPASLAADPDVDLVVVNTRADTHAHLVRPALEAGKPVYVEWPVAESAAVSRALLDPGTHERYKAALEGSIVGLQGRVTPVLTKVGDLLDAGTIGKVLSSEAKVYANLWGRDVLPEGMVYFADRRVGGSGLRITYAHVVDHIQDVLGDLDPDSVKTTSAVLRPDLAVLGADGKTVRAVRSDVPDYLAVSGRMRDVRGRGRIARGAPLAVTLRNGAPFKGQPAFEWSIHGDKGEVLLTSPAGPYLFSGMSYGVRPRIRVHDHQSDAVSEVEWDWLDWQRGVDLKARSVGEVYERYAAWWRAGRPAGELPEPERFPGLLDSQVRMEHLERILRDFDDQVRSME